MWLIIVCLLYSLSVSLLGWAIRSSFRTIRLSERLLAGACPAEWRPFLKLNDPYIDEHRMYLNAFTVGVARLWVFVALKVVIFIGCFVTRLIPFIHVVNFTCKHITRLSLGLDVEEVGEPSRAVNTIVSNHMSMFDGYVLVGQQHHLICVASAAVIRLPVVGRACKALGFIFVDRSDGKSRQEVQSQIDEFQRSKISDDRKLLVFSEGACSNQTGVLRFKLGAFRGLLPVQPVRVEYALKHFAFVGTNSEIAAACFCFCLPKSKVRVTWLPPVVPVKGENPQEFADRVRRAIADPDRGLPLVDAGYGDNFAVEQFTSANA